MKDRAGTYTLEKICNNNVVFAVDSDGRNVVLVGRGIGFHQPRGSHISAESVEQIFVSEEDGPSDVMADLLSKTDPRIVDTAKDLAVLAVQRLGLEPRQSLLLPLLDHLSSAVIRAREGLRADFPLSWEVSRLYPEETQLGREALGLVRARLGVTLQEDEWAAFALHFVNQQWSSSDFSRTIAMTEAISQIMGLIERHLKIPIPRGNLAAARFVTHIRFLFMRMQDPPGEVAGQPQVLDTVVKACPEVSGLAHDIALYLGATTGKNLNSGEVGYLALHLARLAMALPPRAQPSRSHNDRLDGLPLGSGCA